MLDAAKAFDRINHFHLFHKLLACKFPTLTVRLFLYTWYRTQNFLLDGTNVLSGDFNVRDGICQGGVSSPILFSISMKT